MSDVRLHCITMILVALASVSGASAATRYVVAGAVPGGDGLSWTTAYDSLATALNSAQAGDEIWVAQGTYVPGTARQSTFMLRSGVAVFGGFTGEETSREQRNPDPASNLCVLSGDVNGNDTPNFGNRNDNVYHVLGAWSVDAGATVDGFTIRGGNANGAGNNDKRGGGYFGSDSDAVIRNCVFVDNHASNAGGGVACFYVNPRFENCVFDSNDSDTSGGGFHAGSASPVLVACAFRFNTSGSGGAASVSTAHAVFQGCEFADNSSSYVGGAATAISNGSLTFSDCLFSGNSTQGEGGAIWHLGQALSAHRCVFVDNSSNSLGGAVYLYGASAQVARSVFLHNVANEGGAVATSPNVSDAAMRSCVFSGNTATARGGAIACNLDSTHMRMDGCSFFANSALSGGGISVSDRAQMSIENSVLWGNTDQQGGGHLAQVRTQSAIVSIATSDIEGLLPQFQHSGNFDLDPAFVDALGLDGLAGTLDDDLRLQAGSPCIGSGSWLSFGVGEFDLEGEPRVMGGRIDVGADEFTDRPFVFGDMDCDGVRNNFDIDPFVLALSGPEVYAAEFPNCDARNADINGDGGVNNFDIDPFVGLLTLQ